MLSELDSEWILVAFNVDKKYKMFNQLLVEIDWTLDEDLTIFEEHTRRYFQRSPSLFLATVLHRTAVLHTDLMKVCKAGCLGLALTRNKQGGCEVHGTMMRWNGSKKKKGGEKSALSYKSFFFVQSNFSLIPNCSYFRLIRGGKTLNDGKVIKIKQLLLYSRYFDKGPSEYGFL